MERMQAFLIGFGIAGLIGWLAIFLLGSLGIITGSIAQMFAIPQPILRAIPGVNFSGIGARPGQSPLQILYQGCLAIVTQIFLVILVIIILVFIWLNVGIGIFLQQRFLQDTVVGFFFAFPVALLLRWIRNNWAQIVNLYNRIINPPNPTLNHVAPPNHHVVAAQPTISAFYIVLNGIIEIGWRLILQIALLILLYLVFQAAFFYLTNEFVQFSRSTPFGT